MFIYGLLGDEFGVVGKLFVCDFEIGEEIWMCLFVEGYMGRLNGKDSMFIGGLYEVIMWLKDENGEMVEVWYYGGGVLW